MPEGDPGRPKVVRTTLETVYLCTHLLQPYLIGATPKVFEKLATPAVPISALKPSLANLTPGTQTTVGGSAWPSWKTTKSAGSACLVGASGRSRTPKAVGPAPSPPRALLRSFASSSNELASVYACLLDS